MKHEELKLQEYSKPQNVEDNQLAKFMFAARTRMLYFRTNYRNMYTTDVKGPFKCNSEDSQEHLIECDKLEKEPT